MARCSLPHYQVANYLTIGITSLIQLRGTCGIQLELSLDVISLSVFFNGIREGPFSPRVHITNFAANGIHKRANSFDRGVAFLFAGGTA